jgi:hypothetical protein
VAKELYFPFHLTIAVVSIQVPMPFSKHQAYTFVEYMDIKLFGHTHHRKKVASAEKNPIPTVKYGGGIVNFTQYQDILAKNLDASARMLKLVM